MKYIHTCAYEEGKGLEPYYVGTEVLTYNVDIYDDEKSAHFSNSDNAVTSVVCGHCGEEVLEKLEEENYEFTFN